MTDPQAFIMTHKGVRCPAGTRSGLNRAPPPLLPSGYGWLALTVGAPSFRADAPSAFFQTEYSPFVHSIE